MRGHFRPAFMPRKTAAPGMLPDIKAAADSGRFLAHEPLGMGLEEAAVPGRDMPERAAVPAGEIRHSCGCSDAADAHAGMQSPPCILCGQEHRRRGADPVFGQ